MSEKDGASSNNSFLSLLTTQELEDSLRFAMLSEGEADIVQIDALLAELKKRDNQKPDLTPEESLRIFKEKYSGKKSEHLDCAYEPQKQTYKSETPRQTRARRPIVRVALVAAIVVVLILGTMIAAQAAGLDVFGAIARWTDEIFSFSQDAIDSFSELPDYSDEGNEKLTQTTAANDISELKTMEEALKAYGIVKRITPTRIAEGFELTGFEISELSSRTIFQSTYSNGDSLLFINVTVTDSDSAVYEKTDADVLVFNYEEADYYILENNITNLAVWYTEGCECSISGQITTDDLITMIKSINE